MANAKKKTKKKVVKRNDDRNCCEWSFSIIAILIGIIFAIVSYHLTTRL